MRVRDLNVWFPVRSGFLKEIVGGVTRWLHAVDGVSFDLRRGEILCLVGESGCGKTTTGKAMLRLVDTKGGDVFFEMSDAEYQRLEELRAHGGPGADAEIENLRRKYSFTWKESLSWTRRQLVELIAAIALGSFLAMTLPALVAAFFGPPTQTALSLLGFALAVGALVGLVSSLLPVRTTRRISSILAILTIVELAVAQVLSLVVYNRIAEAAPGGPDVGSQYGYFWSTDPFTMLLAYIFAPILAAALSRIVSSTRLQREGRAGIVMRTLRKRLHLIFQDPYESLNPKQSVYEIVSEPLQVNRLATGPEETMARVVEALEDAGLHPASEFLFRFPHELSGGQRQRVSIAAALVLEPDFIVADEPVSMLDVSIRTEILQLLLDLRRRRGLTYLFITHDLSLAWVIADRISVMYLGKIVETGTVEQVIREPKHPYTQALISVIPSPDPRHRAHRMILKGERPDPVNIPTGCRFHPRCPAAFEKCGWNAEEIAQEIKEAYGEVAERLRAAVSERHGRAEAMRSRAKEFPAEASSLEAQAAAVEGEAQQLQPGLRKAEAILAGTHPRDPQTVVVPVPVGTTASDVAQGLRELIAAQRNQRRAFYGVAEISEAADGVTLALHPWSEPPLLEVAPENLVACYLATLGSVPAAPPETVAATP